MDPGDQGPPRRRPDRSPRRDPRHRARPRVAARRTGATSTLCGGRRGPWRRSPRCGPGRPGCQARGARACCACRSSSSSACGCGCAVGWKRPWGAGDYASTVPCQRRVGNCDREGGGGRARRRAGRSGGRPGARGSAPPAAGAPPRCSAPSRSPDLPALVLAWPPRVGGM